MAAELLEKIILNIHKTFKQKIKNITIKDNYFFLFLILIYIAMYFISCNNYFSKFIFQGKKNLLILSFAFCLTISTGVLAGFSKSPS